VSGRKPGAVFLVEGWPRKRCAFHGTFLHKKKQNSAKGAKTRCFGRKKKVENRTPALGKRGRINTSSRSKRAEQEKVPKAPEKRSKIVQDDLGEPIRRKICRLFTDLPIRFEGEIHWRRPSFGPKTRQLAPTLDSWGPLEISLDVKITKADSGRRSEKTKRKPKQETGGASKGKGTANAVHSMGPLVVHCGWGFLRRCCQGGTKKLQAARPLGHWGPPSWKTRTGRC